MIPIFCPYQPIVRLDDSARDTGSQGTATVTGAGSTWSNILGLNVGNFGTGALMRRSAP